MAAAGEGGALQGLFQALYPGGSRTRISYGVFKEAVEPGSVPSDAEQARRREAAADALVNIDEAERARRRSAGLALGGGALVLAAGLPLAGVYGLGARFVLELPAVFLAQGFLASAEAGL